MSDYNTGWNAALDACAKILDARANGGGSMRHDRAIGHAVVHSLVMADRQTAEIFRGLKRQTATPEPAQGR